MPINYNTDRIIIVNYPPGSGGKFLLNCLGLSDQCFFQEKYKALDQLAGKFSSAQKFNLLMDRIVSPNHWNDLFMGDSEFFIASHNAGEISVADLYKQSLFKDHIDHRMQTISNSGHYFFSVCHQMDELKKQLEVWPNAKIINFERFKAFLEFRSNQVITKVNLDIDHTELFDSFNIPYSNAIVWNTGCFLEEENFLSDLRNLYLKLGLRDYNERYVREFYRVWIEKCKLWEDSGKIYT